MVCRATRHDRAGGIEAIEQQQDRQAREGFFDARGQAVKGIGFAVLFAPFGIALLVVEKLAHQWDDHPVLEAEVGFQHIDVVLVSRVAGL